MMPASGPVARDTPARVLIVDNNRDFAEALSVFLKIESHVVEICSDPLQAVGALRNFRPTIVPLDIRMPGMDGYELARAIRSSDEFRALRLIAVTGAGSPEDK